MTQWSSKILTIAGTAEYRLFLPGDIGTTVTSASVPRPGDPLRHEPDETRWSIRLSWRRGPVSRITSPVRDHFRYTTGPDPLYLCSADVAMWWAEHILRAHVETAYMALPSARVRPQISHQGG